jgi:hypothetical protein
MHSRSFCQFIFVNISQSGVLSAVRAAPPSSSVTHFFKYFQQLRANITVVVLAQVHQQLRHLRSDHNIVVGGDILHVRDDNMID